MTDEQWVDWGGASDEEWYASIQRDFGVDARPFRSVRSVSRGE
jgi:hypothetical protein